MNLIRHNWISFNWTIIIHIPFIKYLLNITNNSELQTDKFLEFGYSLSLTIKDIVSSTCIANYICLSFSYICIILKVFRIIKALMYYSSPSRGLNQNLIWDAKLKSEMKTACPTTPQLTKMNSRKYIWTNMRLDILRMVDCMGGFKGIYRWHLWRREHLWWG